MKKSNKLLLGGFLIVILLISAIHISLYAKYKAGEYTIYRANEDMTPQSMRTFPNILFVSVRNVPVANVRFGDVAAVEKVDRDDIQYIQKGDTLLITGKGPSDELGSNHGVAFQLPPNATLSLFNSALSFEGSKTTTENNPVIYLDKSNVFFPGSPMQLGQVKIVASNKSIATFQGNTQVRQLDVQLFNSTITYREGNPGQLSIVTDSLSHISLSSKHLLKANIKTIVPQ